jgi:hypothetical protein
MIDLREVLRSLDPEPTSTPPPIERLWARLERDALGESYTTAYPASESTADSPGRGALSRRSGVAWRSRVLVTVFAAGAIAIGVGAVLVLHVRRVASSATQPSSRVAAPFWYTRAVTVGRDPLPIVPRVMHGNAAGRPVPLVYFVVRTSTETWVGRDGAIRQRIVTLSRRFASASDRRRWTAAHQRLPGGTQGSDTLIAAGGRFPVSPNVPSAEPGDPGDGLFSYQQLLHLPLAPAELRVRIIQAEAAFTRRQVNAYVRPGSRHAQTVAKLVQRQEASQARLYTLIELLESPLSPRLRTALVAATARLPGVNATSQVAAGQISLSETGSAPLTVAVTARTGALVSITGPYAGTSAVVAQGPTSSEESLPRGVATIPDHPSVLPPTGVTITPTRGSSSTAFRVKIPKPTNATVAPFLQATMYGPTGPDCTFFASHNSQAIIPAGHIISDAGKPVAEYSLLPSAIRRTTWCPGTYELQITPLRLTTGASQDLAGSSAAYFNVRR